MAKANNENNGEKDLGEASKEPTTQKPSSPEYNKDELLAIFDQIIFEGEYTEEVLIRGKLKVSFRSRSAGDTSEITKDIDGKQFNLIAALNEYRAFLNLVYSLISYNGKDLTKVTIEDRKALVGKLPAVVVAALSNALFKFDAKTDAACREGEENF